MVVEALPVSLSGGSTEVPRRLGTEARPESENTAKAHWGSLGTCESRRSLGTNNRKWVKPVNNTQAHRPRTSRPARAKQAKSVTRRSGPTLENAEDASGKLRQS